MVESLPIVLQFNLVSIVLSEWNFPCEDDFQKKEKIQKQHYVSPQKSFKLMLPYFCMYCSCAVLTMPEGTCCGRFCKKCIKRNSACLNELTIHPDQANRGNILIPLLQIETWVTEWFSDKPNVTRATCGKARTYIAGSSIPGRCIYYCNFIHIL